MALYPSKACILNSCYFPFFKKYILLFLWQWHQDPAKLVHKYIKRKSPALKSFQFKQTRQTEGVKQRHREGKRFSHQLPSRNRPMKHMLIYKSTIQHFSVSGSSYQPTQRLKWREKNQNETVTRQKEKKNQVQIKMGSTHKRWSRERGKKIFSLQ